MKKILSVILAMAVIFSAFSTLLLTSAEAAPAVLYASADGSGDGTSAETPIAWADAAATIADGGTIYIIGTVGDNTVNRYPIGVEGKAINFVGVDKTTSIIESKVGFAPKGVVFFDNLTFKTNSNADVFLFILNGSSDHDVTLGENVAIDATVGDRVIGQDAAGYSKFTTNGGSFKTFLAGGYNSSLSGTKTDYIVNNSTVENMAVANGWRSGAGDGYFTYSGDWRFEINNSNVTKVVLGHLNGWRRTNQGVAKVVVNEGSTVDAIYMGAEWKELNSTGLRIAEINGGAVSAISNSKESNTNCSYKKIVILNNGMAETVTNIAAVDTKITASKDIYVSAVTEGTTLTGYTIKKPDNMYVLIDGEPVFPNADGIYSISEGEHAVTLTDVPTEALKEVYVSADGTGDGLSPANPTTIENVINFIEDGATVYVVGEIGDYTVNRYPIGSTEKAINFVGFDENSAFVAKTVFHLKGKTSFSNISFKVADLNSDSFSFYCEDGIGDDITFGENVTLPEYTNNGFFPIIQPNTTNTLTINSGNFKNYILAGGWANSQADTNTTVTVNGGYVPGIAVARGWNNGSIFTGTFDFNVNDGKVDTIVLGHMAPFARTNEGTYKAIINGGEVGTVYTGPINTELNGKGVRVLEINGGSVSEVKSRGGSAGTATTKTVAIFNNGMAQNINSISENIDTIIKASVGGKVSAVVSNNAITGYEITSEKQYIYVDGILVLPDASGLYTIASGTHDVSFSDSYTSNDVRINTWVERAEGFISTEGISFSDRSAFDAALENLKYANEYEVPSAVAALKAAWNSVTYTLNGETVTAHLYDFGDTTGDGTVDIRDLVRAKKSLQLGGIAVAPYTLDFNSDGVDDATDLTTLQKNLLGIRTTAFSNTYYKLTQEKKLNVAYFGGSVTVGSGSTNGAKNSWRALTTAWFAKYFPDAVITETNAAIGGTGSEYGMYRAVSDLKLDDVAAKPDLVLIEFAINDVYDGLDYTKAKSNMETIVHTIYDYVPDADIMILFTTDKTQAAQEYDVLRAHKEIAEAYQLPYLAIGAMLWNDMLSESEADTPSDTVWNKYFTDIVHPTDSGYAKYAEYIADYLGRALMKFEQVPEGSANSYLPKTPITTLTYSPYATNAKGMTAPAGFTVDSNGYLVSSTAGSTLTFTFTGTDLKLWTWSTPTSGSIDITIDGINAGSQDLYRNVANSRVIPVASGLEETEHTVTLTLQATDNGSDMELRWFFVSGSDNHNGITLKAD